VIEVEFDFGQSQHDVLWLAWPCGQRSISQFHPLVRNRRMASPAPLTNRNFGCRIKVE
jgi:hypothetical protein